MSAIYIHIPFCVKKCAYCDFLSFKDMSRMGAYASALIRETELAARRYALMPADTVFIGGGTPSTLKAGMAAQILDAVRRYIGIADGAEVTIEANPGTLTPQKLDEYIESGVNRISIGMQSANDALLAEIGRIHTRDDFVCAMDMARSAGFDNINADIMYGLPGQTEADLTDALQLAESAGATHISAYSLILEEHTPLYARVQAGSVTLPDEDEAYALHRLAIEALPRMGYERYEISNYAKPGRKCRHNLVYWNNGEYTGIGLGAHSCIRQEGRWTRFNCTEAMDEYISSIDGGILPRSDVTDISRDEELFECLMLGLRKTEGVSAEELEARFSPGCLAVYKSAMDELSAKGWLMREGGRIFLTDRGLDMQSAALVALMEANDI